MLGINWHALHITTNDIASLLFALFGAVMMQLAQWLITNPAVPAKTVRELIARAGQNPGKLTVGYGSSSSRIAGEMLRTMGGIDIRPVPYKSNPQAITDLLGGQIDIIFADISTTMPQVRAGKANGLAVSTAKRSVLAPELPTMDEAGVKGYDLAAWFAAFVPAKTPQPVVETLREALVAALNDKATQEKLLATGIEPETSMAAALKRLRRLRNQEVGRHRQGRRHSTRMRGIAGRRNDCWLPSGDRRLSRQWSRSRRASHAGDQARIRARGCSRLSARDQRREPVSLQVRWPWLLGLSGRRLCSNQGGHRRICEGRRSRPPRTQYHGERSTPPLVS